MEQDGFFIDTDFSSPLASRVRPRSLGQFVGQDHLIGEGKILRRLIETDRIPSMILWGPPGVGKTTLATIIANATNATFVNYSAATGGIKEVKEIMAKAESDRYLGKKTVLFVDEIHRFNKAQQDAFLPFVEKGSIILIGATTENPSFEVNSALLSRCKVFVLHELTTDDIKLLIHNALNDKNGFGTLSVDMPEELIDIIAGFSNGDARTALNTLEMAVTNADEHDGRITVSKELVEQCMSKKTLLYDKNGEEHYNLISALHKSMRNSDPDAAVYWLARMLEAGEDPLYVARRMVRFASEDIGLADSNALLIANAAYDSSHFIGMPECCDALTQCAIYLSLAPKSNKVDVAYQKAKADAVKMIDEPVPLQIRNAPTGLMKDLGYGDGYQYAHDTKEKITKMKCLPESLQGRHYYEPTDQGQETKFKSRIEAIRKWRDTEDQ